jgi:hypothetical protein
MLRLQRCNFLAKFAENITDGLHGIRVGSVARGFSRFFGGFEPGEQFGIADIFVHVTDMSGMMQDFLQFLA